MLIQLCEFCLLQVLVNCVRDDSGKIIAHLPHLELGFSWRTVGVLRSRFLGSPFDRVALVESLIRSLLVEATIGDILSFIKF